MDPDNFSFLIGNDEYPFLLPIDKDGKVYKKLGVPY